MPLLAAIPAIGAIATGVGAAGGAAAGIAKAKMAADREAKDRQLAADTQRNSPWTGMQAGPIRESDGVGDVLGGTIGGAMAGQGIGNQFAPAPKFDGMTGKSFFDPQTGKPLGQ